MEKNQTIWYEQANKQTVCCLTYKMDCLIDGNNIYKLEQIAKNKMRIHHWCTQRDSLSDSA